MAINVYSGLMGSGKSYEAVKSVIIPAIAAGRRVVSNIDGLNQDAIHAYINAHSKRFLKTRRDESTELGEIVVVSNERVLEPCFFPDDSNSYESVVKGGDLVVIDEAWRFWPTKGVNISPEHQQFFKMHRHYANPISGVTCDLSLIIQDISGLNDDLKKVVELTVLTTKLKSLGLNSRYRVDIYEGHRLFKSTKISSNQSGYDKKIFPLYKSYSVDGAVEKSIDSRQNIFSGTTIWFLLIFALVFIVFGLKYAYNFFYSQNLQTAPDIESPASQSQTSLSSITRPKPAIDPLSSTWRVVGTSTVFGDVFVVLRADATGQLRYEPYSGFVGSGVFLNGVVDGQRVSTYSGGSLDQK